MMSNKEPVGHIKRSKVSSFNLPGLLNHNRKGLGIKLTRPGISTAFSNF